MEINAVEPLDDMAAGWLADPISLIEGTGATIVSEIQPLENDPQPPPHNSVTMNSDMQTALFEGAFAELGRIIDLFA